MNVIVDTGYSGSLTLPPATVTALGLARQSRGRAVLADGTLDRRRLPSFSGFRRRFQRGAGAEV